MEFLNKNHKRDFNSFMTRGNVSFMDNERMALLYIISGNEALKNRLSMIYSLDKRTIIFETDTVTEKPILDASFSSGEQALIRLGFNLFNFHYDDGYTTPVEIFSCLDEESTWLAIEAIKIRFGRV